MGRPPKQGLDWAALRAKFDSGISVGQLATEFDVTRQSIYERIRREGWPKTAQWQKRVVAKVGKARFDAERTPQVAAIILENLSKGVERTDAAADAGISRQKLGAWMAADSNFKEMVELAEGKAAAAKAKRIDEVGARGDWRPDAWWLQRRRPEAYGDGNTQGDSRINVIINVPRSDAPPIVDITPRRITDG